MREQTKDLVVNLDHAATTKRIIGAAIHVHRILGPGFLEDIYEHALAVELDARGLLIETQRYVPVLYRDVEVATHRLDLVVDERIIVELKAVRHLESIHFAQLRSYLNAAQLDVGLLLNFGQHAVQIKRVHRVWTGELRCPPS